MDFELAERQQQRQDGGGFGGESAARRLTMRFLTFYAVSLAVYFAVGIALIKWHAPYLVYRAGFPRDARRNVLSPSEFFRPDAFAELWIDSADGTRLHAYYLQ